MLRGHCRCQSTTGWSVTARWLVSGGRGNVAWWLDILLGLKAEACRATGQRCRLFQDAPAQELVKAAIRDNIGLASEQLPEFKGQCHLVKQAPAGFKFNQEINITVRPVFTAHGRPEHPHVVRSIFGAKAQNIFPTSLMTTGARPLAEAFLCGCLCKCQILLHQRRKQAVTNKVKNYWKEIHKLSL